MRADTISRSGRWAAALIAIVAWIGLAVQLDASVTQVGSLAGAVSAMLRYFTVIANLCAATVMSGTALGRPAFGRPAVLGGTTIIMLLVGVVYALLLRGLLELSGGAKLADLLLHTVTPILVPLFWLGFAPKGGLRGRDPWYWAALPLAYFAYAIMRGTIEGVYAYPFMNVVKLGWAATLFNALALAAAFILASFALVWLDTRLTPRREPGSKGR